MFAKIHELSVNADLFQLSIQPFGHSDHIVAIICIARNSGDSRRVGYLISLFFTHDGMATAAASRFIKASDFLSINSRKSIGAGIDDHGR